jgi:hypothetical protein
MDNKKTKMKWMPILGGCILGVLSVQIPPGTMRAYGELPVPEQAKWVWACLGLLLVWYGIWGHRLRYNKKAGSRIIPTCQKLVMDNKQVKCSDCNALLEPLDGFYERHPEFKEKS